MPRSRSRSPASVTPSTHPGPSLEIVLRKPIIGIDGEGSTHRFDAIRRRIYVLTNDEIEVTEHIGERHLKEWVDDVDEQRGWRDHRYSERGISGLMVPRPDA